MGMTHPFLQSTVSAQKKEVYVWRRNNSSVFKESKAICVMLEFNDKLDFMITLVCLLF